MRWYPLFALCLFMATAHGQSVFECKHKDGTATYQDTPCPGKPDGSPVMTLAKPTVGTLTQLQRLQAMVLIDHFLEAGQFAAAMDVARKSGLEAYLQQRMSVIARQDAARLRYGPGAIPPPTPVRARPFAGVASTPVLVTPVLVAAKQPNGETPPTPLGSTQRPRLAQPSAQFSGSDCLDKSRLSNKMSPVDLWKGIGGCISSGRYDDGVFMFALAGAFGSFDMQRVADDTGHQVIQILPMAVYASLPQDKVSVFQSLASKTLEDETKRLAYCKEIAHMGPPDYFPTYMVQHGIGSFTGANRAQPLVVPFDAKAAWAKAVKQYLLCP
ncbi:MAG: DUF4124 domain-containing protein [Pseudomonadota bacterium]|jgi:hypothetical protein